MKYLILLSGRHPAWLEVALLLSVGCCSAQERGQIGGPGPSSTQAMGSVPAEHWPLLQHCFAARKKAIVDCRLRRKSLFILFLAVELFGLLAGCW